MIETAVILGAGNMAWHLARQLKKTGIEVLQIYSRSDKARELAGEISCKWTNNSDDIVNIAGIYIIAVSDDAIRDVLTGIPFTGDKLVVHTSGSVSIDVFKNHAANYGVIYPLQTLTKGRPINFESVPVLIEANNPANLTAIRQLAMRISNDVKEMSSDKRLLVHLAAVIGSNFTNHLLELSSRILNDNSIPFELLKPLVLETVNKALEIGPAKAQTGPAVRRNIIVIEKHMQILESYPEISEIYRLITNSIYAAANK